MKTKANKIPLVGPRGRKEILKKVEQIAQQDYLIVNLVDFGFDGNSDYTDSITINKQLWDCLVSLCERKIIFDAVIVDKFGDMSKIIDVTVEPTTYKIDCFRLYSGGTLVAWEKPE